MATDDWTTLPSSTALGARAEGTATLVEEEPASDVQSSQCLHLRVAFSKGDFAVPSLALSPHIPLLVGRDVGAGNLRVDDSRMSRLHFRLVFDRRQGVHRILDTNSSNGTYLNGRRMVTGVISPGDVIRAGSTVFVVDNPFLIENAREQADRLAKTHLRVLLTGETGVGKEVFARRIHDSSGRRGPFIAVNCAALPRELAAAELFGHRRGAFSGAVAARTGLFLAAQQGTLLLDEVGELPRDLQALLLRAVEENTVRPIGSDLEVPFDVRLLAATNVPIEELTMGDRFRGDLFARLAQARIAIPPLRHRKHEILPLAAKFASEQGGVALTVEAAEALLLWSWPFNVRELRAFVERFVGTHAPGSPLDRRALRLDFPHMVTATSERASSPPSKPSAKPSNPLANRQSLTELLDHFEGNVAAAARHLGVQRSQIYRWMKRLGIER